MDFKTRKQMKKYHIQNYVRWKHDMSAVLKRLPNVPYEEYNRDELIIRFLPLVESLARKFSTAQQASGVMSINDLIQEGNYGLCAAVDRIDWDTVLEAEDQEKRLKSFLSKRIRGAIRRGVDMNRGSMRIPEHKLNEIRKDFGEDRKMVQLFFNSIFQSIDHKNPDDPSSVYQIADKPDKYNNGMLNSYLLGLLKLHLNIKEYNVLRMSYGLDCPKHTATEIATRLDIKGTSSYVRVSQLKRQAIQKLIDNVDPGQVLDLV